MGIGLFKIYIFSLILNVMDMLSSVISFHLGYTELNAYMGYVHNPWIACMLAIMTYQALMTVLYIVSLRYEKAKIIMTVMTISKIYPIINNTLLLVSVTRV